MNRLALSVCCTLLIFSAGRGYAAQAAPMPVVPPTIAKPAPALPTIPTNPNLDLAYGAYQRGYYITALGEARKRLAANPNDGPAMTLIGQLFDQGLGVPTNPHEATAWYKAAAAHGDREGIFLYGLAKLTGNGIAQDRDGAAALFTKAAAMDDPDALYNLGVLALDTTKKKAPDFPKAADYFRRAAVLGSPDAAYSLALFYREGKGAPQDDVMAAQWMKQAADAGQVSAEVEYAIMLFNGVGVAKDEAAAASLFLKAAARNNIVAQDRAARLLVLGRGIQKDVVEAMKWHLLASAAGEKDAWLDGILNSLTPEQRIEVEVAVKRALAR
jgi:TPR repeat protein